MGARCGHERPRRRTNALMRTRRPLVAIIVVAALAVLLNAGPALAACVPGTVSSQPASQAITYGQNVVFSASATNAADLASTTWQSSTDGTTWNTAAGTPSGTSSTTLTVTKPAVSQSGLRYRVRFVYCT